jgi:phospholipid N-methyltransferase
MVASVVAEAYDFSKFKTICDVGGGQGVLLKAILNKTPAANGILYDMVNVVKVHVLGDLADRVQIVTGSFFESVPPADCMVLKTIIHDWNEENSIQILSNCRKYLNKGGKIILIEQVVEEPFTLTALFYDLHMQVMLGGTERTEQEYNSLFEAAGLKTDWIINTKSPMKIIVTSQIMN